MENTRPPSEMTTGSPATPPLTLEWHDFHQCGWERTPLGQFTFFKGPVELTLLEPDMTGRAEIMVQAMTERKMSQRSIRFPLPVTITIYNESIAIVERWHSVELPELKFQDVEQINRCAPAP